MLTPDAAPALALEREKRLQVCRDLVLDNGNFDLDSVLWVAQLAANGHVPAQALLERALTGAKLRDLHAADAARFAEGAATVPRFAGWLAARETQNAAPDVAVLRRWRPMDLVFAALDESGVAPGDADFVPVAQSAQEQWHGSRDDERIAADLLTGLAEARLKDGDPVSMPAGLALLGRAAALAPGGARRWTALYDLAGRSPYMQRWLDKFPVPSLRQPDPLMSSALDYETGTADGKPDLASAILLYEMGTNVPAWQGTEGGELDSEFCLAVGRWLDWRAAADHQAGREAGLRWYERVTGRGDPRALGLWMLGTAKQGSIVAREPEQVLAELERYLAMEPAGADRFPLSNPVSLVLRQAKQLLATGGAGDASLAARSLRVPVRLGDAEAQYLLGVLLFNGKGVERDRDAARRLLEASAVQGRTSAREALEKIKLRDGPH